MLDPQNTRVNYILRRSESSRKQKSVRTDECQQGFMSQGLSDWEDADESRSPRQSAEPIRRGTKGGRTVAGFS